MSKQGLNEEQFKILEPQMGKWVNRNHYGRKLAPWRPVVNTIFWVLRTGAPWKDAPRSKEFSHPSTAHAWLGRMQSSGFLDQFLEELLKIAEQLGCIEAQRLSIDGFFFQRTRRRRTG
jgi:transposase